jgi:hypothetical protein
LTVDESGFHIPVEQRSTGSYSCIDLTEAYNSDVISWNENRADGDIWVNGVAYPAEELPESNSTVYVNNVPFIFPDKRDGKLNCMTLESQTLSFPSKRTSALYMLCAGDNGDFDVELALLLSDNSYSTLTTSFPSWMNIPYTSQHTPGLICSHGHLADADHPMQRTIWFEHSGTAAPVEVTGIRFPANPFAKLIAITLGDG